MGTISFRSAASDGKMAGGAGIDAGAFALGAEKRLPAGPYQVTIMAFQKTGRTIDDPLRGPQPETLQLTLADNPMQVEITDANATSLKIEVHSQGRP
jgi:hypothetical protein